MHKALNYTVNIFLMEIFSSRNWVWSGLPRGKWEVPLKGAFAYPSQKW